MFQVSREHVEVVAFEWIVLQFNLYVYKNVSFHGSLKGYEPPSFLDLLLTNSRVTKALDLLQQSQDIMRSLKENIQQAQNQQKQCADQHRVERQFEINDLVHLRLQLYR